jgi:hypothetical protein
VQEASKAKKLKGLTKETYEATLFTAQSSHACVMYLLSSGFLFVLTRTFSSDPIEATFSTFRSMGGSDDAMDARAVHYAMKNVLTSGLITASNSANVTRPGASNFHSTSALAVVEEDEPLEDEHPFELSESASALLAEIENSASIPLYANLESAAQALLGGYLVRTVEERMDCCGCIDIISQPRTSSPLLDLVYKSDRGGYRYPNRGKCSFLLP